MIENFIILWWHWAIMGLGLIVIELVAPAAFFLWIGLASLTLSGAVALWPAMDTALQIVMFCALAFIFTYGGRRWAKSNTPAQSSLNKRGAHNIGKNFMLTDPIVDGKGRLNIDDTLWLVQGEDLPKGTHVTIIAIEDNTLIVEKTR